MAKQDLTSGNGEPIGVRHESTIEKAKRLAEEAKAAVARQNAQKEEDDYGRYEELYREREALQAEIAGLMIAKQNASEAIVELEAVDPESRTSEIEKYLSELRDVIQETESNIENKASRIRGIDNDPVFVEIEDRHKNERRVRLDKEKEQREQEQKEKNIAEVLKVMDELRSSSREIRESVEQMLSKASEIKAQMQALNTEIRTLRERSKECRGVVTETLSEIMSLFNKLDEKIQRRIREAASRSMPDVLAQAREDDRFMILRGGDAETVSSWFASWIGEVKPGFIFSNKALVALRHLSERPELEIYGTALKRIRELEKQYNQLAEEWDSISARIRDTLENSELMTSMVGLINSIIEKIRLMRPTEDDKLSIKGSGESVYQELIHELHKLGELVQSYHSLGKPIDSRLFALARTLQGLLRIYPS
jgi:chromosome segregation ATPase